MLYTQSLPPPIHTHTPQTSNSGKEKVPFSRKNQARPILSQINGKEMGKEGRREGQKEGRNSYIKHAGTEAAREICCELYTYLKN